MRLIDADALLQQLRMSTDCDECESCEFACGSCVEPVQVCEAINAAPTIKPKRGKWIHHDCGDSGVFAGVSYYTCSECGEEALTEAETLYDGVKSNFCPNCGAKMEN